MTDACLATRGQLRELGIALARFGLADRSACLGYVSCVVGYPVTSRKQLTTRQASAVLDRLDEVADHEPRSAA